MVLAIAALSITLFSCGGNSNNESKTVTIKDSESEVKITANVDQKKVPTDFPSDYYLIKGSIDNVITLKQGQQQIVTIYMHVESTSKEVRDDILKNMEEKGWKTKMNVASQLYFTKGKKILRVGLTKDGNQTGLSYIATY
ncbi:MAG TPA: hypothetical protein EYP69_02835 [Bacteroidales bacterium]|nr:hypothetical protein [Bacteroidales bacterium]